MEHASAQARARNYQDFLIVDADSHHYENESYKDLFQYIDNPVIRRAAIESTKRPGRSSTMNSQVGYQDTGGRITRHELRKYEKVHADTFAKRPSRSCSSRCSSRLCWRRGI